MKKKKKKYGPDVNLVTRIIVYLPHHSITRYNQLSSDTQANGSAKLNKAPSSKHVDLPGRSESSKLSLRPMRRAKPDLPD